MSHSQVLFIIIAIIIQVFGYIGYKKNKWSFDIYYYAFSVLAQFFATLGIIPIRFPQSTILQRIEASVVISLGTLGILYYLRKDLRKPKNN